LFNLGGNKNYTRKDKNTHSTSLSMQVFVLDLRVTQKPKNKPMSLPQRSKVIFSLAIISYIEFYRAIRAESLHISDFLLCECVCVLDTRGNKGVNESGVSRAT